MSRNEAFGIYTEIFIDRPGFRPLVEHYPVLAEEIIDAAVLSGPKRAVKWLQACLNGLNIRETAYADVVEDGIFGPKTLQALKTFFSQRGDEGLYVLRDALNCLQGAYFINLAALRVKDEEFLYGWLKHRIVLGRDGS